MQELKLIGVEDKDLILAADDGATYRLTITPTIVSAVRPPAPPVHSRKKDSASPRELQALLRSGLTAEQVAEQTGVVLEDIRRFEAPIAAELAYMIDTARDLPLRLTSSGTGDDGSSFGEIIDSRLHTRNVSDAQWSSWKEETFWVIQVEFTSGGAHLDARWSFEPKRHVLTPLNDDARSISAEEAPIPSRATRLRAIPSGEKRDVPPIYDRELDEGALEDTDTPAVDDDQLAVASVTPISRKQAPEAHPGDVIETSDLLDALRQRRGERQPAATEPEELTPVPPVTIDPELAHAHSADPYQPEIPTDPSPELDVFPQAPDPVRETTPRLKPVHAQPPMKTRGNRPSMPSWDEIVFGSRGNSDETH